MSVLIACRAVQDRSPSHPGPSKPLLLPSTRMSEKNIPPHSTTTKPNTFRAPHPAGLGYFDSSLIEHGPSTPAKNAVTALHDGDTPITKAQNDSRHRVPDISMQSHYLQYEKEFRGLWVGPVPTEAILELLPATDKAMPKIVKTRFTTISKMAADEKVLLQPLVRDLPLAHHNRSRSR